VLEVAMPSPSSEQAWLVDPIKGGSQFHPKEIVVGIPAYSQRIRQRIENKSSNRNNDKNSPPQPTLLRKTPYSNAID
jgi:hypothetical protein